MKVPTYRLLIFAVLLPVSAKAQLVRSARVDWSIMVSDAVALRTASHNERIDGDFRALALQASRPVYRLEWKSHRIALSWLGEISPAILVKTGAPANRIPMRERLDAASRRSSVASRYSVRNVFGVGLAPLGAEARIMLGERVGFALSTTSGGAWFTDVVPYGKATQANFTVAPGAAVEIALGGTKVLAVGYALHHLSNASFGGANPGLNSHLVTIRIAELHKP